MSSKSKENTSVLDYTKNFYVEFLNNSRWIDEEQKTERRYWFDEIDCPDKRDVLFKFEFLLKGLCCMGNPANLPGILNNEEGEDFLETANLRSVFSFIPDIFLELIDLGVKMGSKKGGTIESPLDRVSGDCFMNDEARFSQLDIYNKHNSPQESLEALICIFQNFYELASVVAAGQKVSFRQYTAFVLSIQKEVVASIYLNPLSFFEFRSQYDGITIRPVLSTLTSIEHYASRRMTTLTMLSIFRILNYLDVIALWQPEMGRGSLYAMLAALRSDGRGLSSFLISRTALWLSSDFGREFEHLKSDELRDSYDDLDLQFSELKSLRELLESTGNQLELEFKKSFHMQLPQIFSDSDDDDDAVVHKVINAVESLRSFLQNVVVLLVSEFNVHIKGDDIFEDFTSDLTRTKRLWRDIWMFRQILKAFIAKTQSAKQVGDRWTGLNTIKYVATFVDYFRSMGYQLLRYSDYDNFDKFMALVDRLREGDVLEVQRPDRVIDECEAFLNYLSIMFEAVSNRKELEGANFDKADASATLKLFIG